MAVVTESDLDADDARQRLYEVMAGEEPFERKVQQALELGQRYLDVDNGHVTRIDRATDYWEVVVSTEGPDGDFPPGLVLDLDVTYCRRTMAADSPVAVADASADPDWQDDPAVHAHGVQCYHGTTLTVDGELYGTVCFVSEAAHEPFTAEETIFSELVARLVEHGFERRRHESELAARESLVSVLSRVLRHNIRNDMTVIRGTVARLAEELDDPERVQSVVDAADGVIQLGEKARTLEQLVSTDMDRETVDCVALVERAVEGIRREHPEASITVEGPDAASMQAMPSLETALREVLDNAVKHGGDPPAVVLSVTPRDDRVEIAVRDGGPGLPPNEQAVLRGGVETPLAHGSGLGLWLVHWVVASHDGRITTDVSESGTTVTLEIPRRTAAGVNDRSAADGRVRQGYDRFRAVFDEAFDAMVVLDDDRRVVDANPSAADLFGVPAAELLGRRLAEFVGDADDAADVWGAFMASGQGVTPIEDAGGDQHLVEFTASANIIPGQHLVVGRDVTERARRERRLEALKDGFPYLCFVIDEDGTYRDVLSCPSTEDRLYEDPEALLGRTVQDVLPDAVADRFMVEIRAVIETGQPRSFEYDLAVPAGERRFEARAHPLRLAFDDERAASVVVRDVTDRDVTAPADD